MAPTPRYGTETPSAQNETLCESPIQPVVLRGMLNGVASSPEEGTAEDEEVMTEIGFRISK